MIDDKENRPDFFKMLMKNEKIEYLEEVYDSKNNGFNYHVKLFKIDFSKLE